MTDAETTSETASRADRIAAAAATVRPVRILLSVLASPFYAVGYLAGILLVAASWCYAAVTIGAADARQRRAGSE